jgi:hypothetical protein
MSEFWGFPGADKAAIVLINQPMPPVFVSSSKLGQKLNLMKKI